MGDQERIKLLEVLKKIGLHKIDDSKGEIEIFVSFPNFDLTNPG